MLNGIAPHVTLTHSKVQGFFTSAKEVMFSSVWFIGRIASKNIRTEIPSVWGFQCGASKSRGEVQRPNMQFKTNWAANIVSQNQLHEGTANLKGRTLSFIFTLKRSASNPLSRLDKTHILHTHTHTHTHIPASCPRTIFTSRPRYQNSLFPLSPFYTVIFSVILLSISGEWIISVFTACSRGRYDERQISLSIVSHLLNFYQTVICLQQVYTVKVTGTGRTLMCDVLWHLQSTEQVLGHCSWHSNYLRNIVDWSAISSAAG